MSGGETGPGAGATGTVPARTSPDELPNNVSALNPAGRLSGNEQSMLVPSVWHSGGGASEGICGSSAVKNPNRREGKNCRASLFGNGFVTKQANAERVSVSTSEAMCRSSEPLPRANEPS